MKVTVNVYVQNGYLLLNFLHNFLDTVRIQRKQFELSLVSYIQETALKKF